MTTPKTKRASATAVKTNYAPPPKGHARLWLITYRIDGKWQQDGEWFLKRRHAEEIASDNGFGWQHCLVPLDVPRGLLRDGRATERRAARKAGR